MLNQELKFEYGKWYQFKDVESETEFRNLYLGNSTMANQIITAGAFTPVFIADTDLVSEITLWSGEILSMRLYPTERRFFTVYDPDEGCDSCEDGCEAQFEPSEFPLTKFTISNNEEAWTVYQMLKAHFKE